MELKLEKEIILASQSPRRQELLHKLGVPFQVVSSQVVEEKRQSEVKIEHYVMKLALQKAEAVAKQYPEKVIISADTIVSANGQVLPKPENAAQAKAFLKMLSGKTHSVLTAVAIIDAGEVNSFISKTEVTFYTIPEEMIEAYIQTEDPYDKAGAYGIQSDGLFFVKEIQGDYYSVMGLPLALLTKKLFELNILSFGKDVRSK